MLYDIKQLKQSLDKKSYSNLYLIFGEERYLINQYSNLIKNSIISDNDNFNLCQCEGKDIDFKEIISLSETVPFFSDYRLIILDNSKLFSSSNDIFINHLKEVPEHTIFLFIEDNVDKRSKLYKLISSSGVCMEIKKQTEGILITWIKRTAGADLLNISDSTAKLLLEKTGTDMYIISNELKKLIAYCFGKETIERTDVNSVCCSLTPPQIFDMITAISEKNSKKTIELYYELLEEKTAPLLILNLLARQFKTLYRISLLKENGLSDYEISSRLSLSSYIIQKCKRQAANFSSNTLLEALYDCNATEEKIKSGRLTDNIGVELLLVKYTR